MTQNTKVIMAKVRRMLTRLQKLESGCLGHESEIHKAMNARFQLEEFLEETIELLSIKGGAR